MTGAAMASRTVATAPSAGREQRHPRLTPAAGIKMVGLGRKGARVAYFIPAVEVDPRRRSARSEFQCATGQELQRSAQRIRGDLSRSD